LPNTTTYKSNAFVEILKERSTQDKETVPSPEEPKNG